MMYKQFNPVNERSNECFKVISFILYLYINQLDMTLCMQFFIKKNILFYT